jgi:hypothetical protein
MKDEEAIDWMEVRISRLPLDKENKLKEGVMGGLPRKILCVFGKEKEEDECVRKKLVLMCGKIVVHEKNKMCANKEHGRKLCVTNSCNGVHRRIFMKKPLDSYFK